MGKICALILTKNEELHLERCINSILPLVNKIYVVDSGSTDNTFNICEKYKVSFFTNPWINYAKQFNYGLDLVRENKFEWILRIDADEIFPTKLINEVKNCIDTNGENLSGLILKRRFIFQNKIIRYGGSTCKQLRIFRPHKGYCEDRYMDEHIRLEGKTKSLKEPFYDYSLKNLTWWIQKHNLYSNREVVDILNLREEIKKDDYKLGLSTKIKRNLKSKIYGKSPILLRSFFWFLFRYIFLFGFLDGIRGLIFIFCKVFGIDS